MSERAQPPEFSRTWPLRTMAIVLACTGLIPLANYLTPAAPLTYWAPAVEQWILWGTITAMLALLFASMAPAVCDRVTAWATRLMLAPSSRLFSVTVGILTCGLVLFFGWELYRWQPVTLDELSQEWQAVLLTHGRLFLPVEAHGEFFSTMQTLERDGRWFAQFPIGGAALQSIWMLFRVPWLENPIFAGCAAVALYRFVAAVSSELEARSVAILFALSPFVLFVAGSQLNHTAALAAIWVAIAALPSWWRAQTAAEANRPAAIIGAGLGVAATIRPYDAALIALVIAGFQLRALFTRRWLIRSLLVQVGVGAIPVIVLLAVNAATTGDPFLFAYDALNGPEHRPGFHPSPLGFDHTPRHGLYTISLYLMRLNIALLGWPVPALVLVVVALLWQRRATWADHLLVALLAAVLLGYAYYWAEGSFHGPRFLFPALPVFLIFVARLSGVLRALFRRPALRRTATLFIPLCLLTAWVAPINSSRPFGVWSLAERAVVQDRVTPRLLDAVRRDHLSNAVVFVPDGWHARLTARLRKLGARPYNAQLIVGHYDACLIQQLLDRAEASGWPLGQQSSYVFSALDQLQMTRPVPGLNAQEQLALTPQRPLTPACRREFSGATSNGVDLARLLPREGMDATGHLGGAVVYARDFGDRNELLRDRFGDRAWYTARVEGEGQVTLVPYARSAGDSLQRAASRFTASNGFFASSALAAAMMSTTARLRSLPSFASTASNASRSVR